MPTPSVLLVIRVVASLQRGQASGRGMGDIFAVVHPLLRLVRLEGRRERETNVCVCSETFENEIQVLSSCGADLFHLAF